MDDSAMFQSMLDKAIKTEPLGFTGFDRTKNVQDQLQEMIKQVVTGQWSPQRLASEFADFACDGSRLQMELSMEQLWLAFCMSVKYNKIWDGGKWIAKS